MTADEVEIPTAQEEQGSETHGQRLKSDKVEMRVHAAGVNFQNVLKSFDPYRAEFNETLDLGAKCSGTVMRVGSGVTSVQRGDRVVVCASFCFASFATARAAYTAKIPEQISYERAASLFGP
jgi:NADPH:quinone reductase-like Zn-dependent oxidoreductase